MRERERRKSENRHIERQRDRVTEKKIKGEMTVNRLTPCLFPFVEPDLFPPEVARCFP